MLSPINNFCPSSLPAGMAHDENASGEEARLSPAAPTPAFLIKSLLFDFIY
jgi:hypothetical protein